MKKKWLYLRYNTRVSKLLRKMKLTIFLLLTAIMGSMAAGSYSQSAKLTLDFNNSTVKEILGNIEDQSEFRFFYSGSVDVERQTSISLKNEKIFDVLDELFEGTNVNYEVRGRQIALVKGDETFGFKSIPADQQRTVSGTITDESDDPLPGVSVIVKGTTTGTVTDSNGRYSLSNVPSDATLVYSFVGMKKQEIAVKNQTEINVEMEADAIGIEEVVAVGYGTRRKGELTVSVSQVRGDALQSIPKTSVMETLGGRAAGVDVISSSGAPGAGSKIRIRGANSIRSGAEPLYVIDGFPVAATMNDLHETSRYGISGDQTSLLAMINPNDIESIEFLKDAAATSIYGARGANGVVIITTKSGKKGRSDITLSVNTGLETVAKKWDMMNSTEFSHLLYDAFERGGIDMENQAFNPTQRLAIPTEYDTDWLDETFRTGLIQDYNLSFSGASERTNYSGSIGYLDSEGIIRENSYKRYSARLNGESTAWEGRLKAGANINISYVDQKAISNSLVYQTAMQMAPNYPVYFPEGTLYEGYLINGGSVEVYDVLWGDSYGSASSEALTQRSPFYQTDFAKNPTNQARIISNGFLSLELVDGLIAKTSVGTDLNYSKMKYLVQSDGPFAQTGASLEHKQNQNYTWLIENTLNYSKEFDKHSLNILFGQSAQKFYAEGLGFAVEENEAGKILIGNNPFFVDGWWFDNGVHDHLTTLHKYAKVAEWSVASYFSRINYSYLNKYLLTATLRRDGSSKFGKDNKWGWFPGVSAAWNLHNEDFFNIENLDQLKIRASWGVVGNGNIVSYLSQPLLIKEPATYVGVVNAGTSAREQGLVDPALSWESTREFDVGVDAIFNNRWSITTDVFWKKTYNLLYGFDLPESTGFTDISTTNLGSLKQFGAELSVSGDIIQAKSSNDLNWNASLILDHLSGKITDLPSGTDWVGNYIRSYVDEPIGVIYGYIVDGIYDTQAELDDPNNPYASAELGDYMYRDVGSVDENGKFVDIPDNNITGADRVDLGNVNPVVSFGFSNTITFKQFDFNIFFRGSIGNKIYNQTKRELLDLDGNSNTIKEAINRWTPDNNSQTIQAANSNRKDPTGGAPISIFVEDGSYIRLANLNFGYTLPRHTINSIGMQSLRLYASINNLFVITGYSGLDPEVGGADVLVPRGIDASAYPKSRTFSLGLNVKF